MSVIIVCTVPASEFLLGEFFQNRADWEASLERVVPLDQEPVPYLWIEEDQRVMTDLERDGAVESVTVVDETEEGQLVKVEWDTVPDQLIDVIAETGGALLEGHAKSDQWTLHLRFPGQDQLEAFHDACRSAGIDLLIDSVHDDESSMPNPVAGLTEDQAATLKVALERGYFEVPRQTTLEELAAEFDISDTAVSQRLRRALGTLVVSSLRSDEDRSS